MCYIQDKITSSHLKVRATMSWKNKKIKNRKSMRSGSDVIASNRSIGKSSHVVGRTTMLGICLCIRALIWQGISGLDRWSNRLRDWKENWMWSGSKRNTPIDTVRTNQNQWQGLGNDAVMAAGHEKYERKGKKMITCYAPRRQMKQGRV